MKRFVSGIVLALGLFAATRSSEASPIGIQYQATDLADIVSGEDLWQYSYTVSNAAFQADQGFSILFSYALFKNLQSPPPAVNADWDVLTFDTDASLSSDGIYDALALVNNASLVDPFVLSFVWLGGPGTAPGSQPFTVNQYDAQGNLSIIDSGRTLTGGAAAVPEPSSLLLLATGCGAVASRLRRRVRERRAPR